MLLPLPGRRLPRDGATLTNLRSIFLLFVAATWLFWVPLLAIAPRQDGVPPMGPGWGLAALYALAAGLGGVVWARSRPLRGTTPEQVRSAYLANLFLKLAFADVPALVGFVGFFLTNSLLAYLAGFLLSQLCFLLAAPTSSDVQRRQQELWARGSLVPLLDALL